MTKIIIDKNQFSKIKVEYDHEDHYSIQKSKRSDLGHKNLLLFLLLNITDIAYTYRGIEIKKGQVLTSKKEINEELKISYLYINEYINSLSSQNFISYEEITLYNSSFLLITVIDCNCYKIEFGG